MTQLLCDPFAPRQLAAHGLCVFWRDHPSGRGREGFACQLLACTAAQCGCSSLFVEGVMVDDRIAIVEMRGGQMGLRGFDPPGDERPRAEGLLSLRWDHQAGTVEPLEGLPAGLAAVAPWLRGELDDELRAYIQRTSAQQRLRAGADHDLWTGWQPGDLVCHLEHFPNHGFAALPDGKVAWRFEDLHCIDPQCTCQDVIVVVSRLRHDEPEPMDPGKRYAGHLALELPDPHPQQVVADGRFVRSRRELLQLWTKFVRRNPHLVADLKRRQAQMKRLRPPMVMEARPVIAFPRGRVGLCACGSGLGRRECCAGGEG
ncbi:MAG: hypothetical protein R3F29_03730 [Planctomycetota bacterium]